MKQHTSTVSRRVLATLVALVTLVAGLAVAAPAHAIPDFSYTAPTQLVEVPVGETRTSLASLAMSPRKITLVRQQGARVTVTMRLTDPDPQGVRPYRTSVAEVSVTCPCVHVSTADKVAGQHESAALVELTRASGTAQDGVWTGSFLVGAGSRGDWQVAGVLTEDFRRDSCLDFNCQWDFVPERDLGLAAPTTTVSGSQEVVLGLTVPTTPGGPYAVRVRARYAGTGAPAAGVKLTLARNCFSYVCTPVKTFRTDARGNYTHRVTGDPRGSWRLAFGLEPGGGPDAISVLGGDSRWRRATLTLDETPATIAPGEVITAQGTFGPANGDLRLQQRKGGTWRTVRTTPTIAGDRYTFRLRPGGSGTKTYRVQVPSKARGWIGQNRTFSVVVG